MKTTTTPETLNDCIGLALRDFRISEKLKQREFCLKYTLVAQSCLSRYEAGNVRIPGDLLLLCPEIHVKALEIAKMHGLLEVESEP